MVRPPKLPLSRDRAWACVTLNFSISGLGTLKAGRIVAGTGQVLFNFAGLFLIGWWLCQFIYQIFQGEMGETPSHPAAWLWKWGAICIGISWTWMLVTCVSLMRRAKTDQENNARSLPPRLADLPEKNPEQQ